MSSEPTDKIAPHMLYRSTDTQEDYFYNRRALSANHQEEMIRDGLRRIKTILVWTDTVLDEQNMTDDFEQSITDFFERVKGGLFLCRLANAICPNSIHMKGRSQKATFNKRFLLFSLYLSLHFSLYFCYQFFSFSFKCFTSFPHLILLPSKCISFIFRNHIFCFPIFGFKLFLTFFYEFLFIYQDECS